MINGIEAMGDTGGELTVTSKRSDDGQLLISVTDSGPGLPDDSECIFEAFFTTKPQGTGMGLSISRRIVELHGGRLWASRSTEGARLFSSCCRRRNGVHTLGRLTPRFARWLLRRMNCSRNLPKLRPRRPILWSTGLGVAISRTYGRRHQGQSRAAWSWIDLHDTLPGIVDASTIRLHRRA
jgi:Histidine kinase-, DNA gyrase B-, and HSP90-like ATPase